ncbi:hypothetical protein EG68_02069 [Paragonimus skrjabini miyazakii]|uniref:Uncharacterized protein n=1 Tax=Paragonimus skrjabini miyazakii TaxID=59628 RepID=A0A8S9Z3U9_9TREM|nr:hypothetical protein EG68_02069 [Paragonimus skrjabini miyazakii]
MLQPPKETTAWTTEEIAQFQHGLRLYGRDFHQVAKDLQANGMNKTVKACVEFYYVWKRMNTPSDVKWYRERARRQRLATRTEPVSDKPHAPSSFTSDPSASGTSKEHSDSTCNTTENTYSYNLRRKYHPNPVEKPVADERPSNIGPSNNPEDSSALEIQPCPSLVGGTDWPMSSDPEVPVKDDEEESGMKFPCHLCHRVFAKVKSRNAHMRSHSDHREMAIKQSH